MPKSPEPQPSAAVILIDPEREGPGFRLYLLRRAGGSRFMPGRYVFPGGRVEPGDGPEPRSDTALRACALRELWEEAGVCLAQPRPGAPAPEQQALAAARARMLAGEQSAAEALAGLGLSPAPEALTPYARWITPEARPQRFDTTFYLARMPAGQAASADRTETEAGLWLAPEEALAENAEGRVSLAPPQVRILGELATHRDAGELLAAAAGSDLAPVMPVLHAGESGRVIMLPWDRDYAAGVPADPARPCPAGSASRLAHSRGRWLPLVAE